MTTTVIPALPGQANKLAVLLDALDCVVISDGERASPTWLAGFEASTVENIAEVITRCPTDPVAEVSDSPTTGDLVEVAAELRFPCDRRARFPARLTEYPTGLDGDTDARDPADGDCGHARPCWATLGRS